MKVIELTALDGAKWHIPVSVVAEHHARDYADRTGRLVPEALIKVSMPLFEANPQEAIDWAARMEWEDVKPFAQQVTPADRADMVESWKDGKKRVISGSGDLIVPPTTVAAVHESTKAYFRAIDWSKVEVHEMVPGARLSDTHDSLAEDHALPSHAHRVTDRGHTMSIIEPIPTHAHNVLPEGQYSHGLGIIAPRRSAAHDAEVEAKLAAWRAADEWRIPHPLHVVTLSIANAKVTAAQFERSGFAFSESLRKDFEVLADVVESLLAAGLAGSIGHAYPNSKLYSYMRSLRRGDGYGFSMDAVKLLTMHAEHAIKLAEVV